MKGHKSDSSSHSIYGISSINSYLVGWKKRCAEYFPYSTYFEGSRSSAVPGSAYNQNGSANHADHEHNAGSIAVNGNMEAFKDLNIQS